jgi:hypothetical protein
MRGWPSHRWQASCLLFVKILSCVCPLPPFVELDFQQHDLLPEFVLRQEFLLGKNSIAFCTYVSQI